MKRKHKLSRRTRKNLVRLLLVLLVIAFVGSGILLVERLRNPPVQEAAVERKTMVWEGEEYFPRQDVDTFLVIGTDVEGPVVASDTYYNEGQADAVFLLILDRSAEEIRVLTLNRDSMVTMPALNESGRPSGTYYGQLAQSHAYGSGLEDSCENTRQTVSDLLHGVDIDHYVSFHLDAIGITNDAVGGVTVTVTDDFGGRLPMGEVTLQGDQAETFVRGRKDVGDQLNVSRMERQKVYLESFLGALQAKQSANPRFALSLYEDIAPYMVTDCSATVFGGFLDLYSNYDLVEIVTPEGENVRGETYMEFYLDQESLDELTVRLLYAPKE